ncbi:MAG: alpha-ketoglutarate-dependent dioxygenase AlkB [Parvibaculaceae bacterium]
MRDKVQPLTPAEPARTRIGPFPDDAAPGAPLEPAEGTIVWPGALPRARQEALVATLREALAEAPFYRVRMPRTGRPLSVSMTNLGRLGWISDKQGYRYEPRHPVTGRPWPPIPEELLRIWNELTGYPALPEACLVNFYAEGARMGLHQDRDEEPMDAPVLSVSLGDTAVFRLGGLERKGRTQSFRLHSGDVMMLAGPSRLRFHGIDRILPGSSTLLEKGGRLNLTLRRVTAP